MNVFIILMSGMGHRMNLNIPKQYIEINNKPIYIFTLENVLKNKEIDKIILVINEGWNETVRKHISSFINKKNQNKIEIIIGGNSRNKSIINAMKYCNSLNINSNDIILTHDSARPLVSKEIISNNIKAVKENINSVINTSISISDTISQTSKGKIKKFIDRKSLLSHQTPQSATFETMSKIVSYIEKKNIDSTDLIYIAYKIGLPIVNVCGELINFKITNKTDLDLFKEIKGERNDK